MQCGDVIQAETLFDASIKKPQALYGAMMKGENYHISKYIQRDIFFKAI